MANSDNQHENLLVVNLIDNPVFANPNAIQILFPLQLQAAVRPGVVGKPFECLCDASNHLGGQCPQLLLCRRRHVNVIGQGSFPFSRRLFLTCSRGMRFSVRRWRATSMSWISSQSLRCFLISMITAWTSPS